MELSKSKQTKYGWHICLIVIIPLLANLPILAGISQCDPTLLYSGLGHGLTASAIPGNACFVDVTIGWITQPLGYLSAQDWLHGIVPWWNPYSGVGMPLAAEVQNESFFLPFVLLLHFKGGWLYQRILFQILCGLFTYIFLCQRRLHRLAALTGALLFALNGSFFLHAGSGSCPIFCLPLMMCGVERAFAQSIKQQSGGWSVVTLGTALSIYAGFPEIAFFDGLLVAFWAIIRTQALPASCRSAFISKLALGLCIGIAVTAPLTLAFLQYLSVAEVAAHARGFAHNTLELAAAPIAMFPYIYGGLAVFLPSHPPPLPGEMWVEFGGWIGFTPFVLALSALIPIKRAEFWRYGLALWVFAWTARDFNWFHITALFNLVPGIAHANAVRFSAISVEFSAYILAAAGMHDLLTLAPLKPRHLIALGGLCGICIIASVFPAIAILKVWFETQPNLKFYSEIYLSLCVGFCLIFYIAATLPRFIGLLPLSLTAGAIAMFLLPQFAAPHGGSLDLQGLAKLQSLEKTSRLYSIGPFGPNFPAQYQISEINHSQLPAPKLWTDYVTNSLFANANTIDLTGGQPNQIYGLIANLANYQAIGVKYVVAFPSQNLSDWLPAPKDVSTRSGFQTLFGQTEISGKIEAQKTTTNISAVSMFIGTIFGDATGILQIKICGADNCAVGSLDVSTIPDDYRANIHLDKPLTVAAGTPVTFTISHLNGSWVSVFLTGADNGVAAMVKPDQPNTLYFEKQHLPVTFQYRLAMITPANPPKTINLPTVYRDNDLAIYQLRNPAPFASASDPSCNLAILSLQHLTADCRQPATLIRRELFFPGWRAQINKQDTLITVGEHIFEQISLPAGPSDIRFSYMPLHTRSACALAVLALLFWLGCVVKRAYFDTKKPAT